MSRRPKSNDRAPSCCRHRYHHRRNRCCHRHRHDSHDDDNNDDDRQTRQRFSCCCCCCCCSTSARYRVTCQSIVNVDDRLGVDVTDDRREELWNRRWRDEKFDGEEETDRLSIDRVNRVDEPRGLKTIGDVGIDGDDDEGWRRTDRLDGDDQRFIWETKFRGFGRQRREFGRNGRRGFAINAFLLATAGAFFALAVVLPPVSGTSSDKDDTTRTRTIGTITGTAMAETSSNQRTNRVPLVDTRTSSSSSSTITTTSGGDHTGSIDLLAALQLYNTTHTGVSQVPGLARLKPAYYLQGEERDLRLNEASFERAAALLRRVPEFTLAAALRQEEANSGTIVAFSHGNNRYLELQSSGRKDELRLHYVSRRDGTVHVESFPYRLADGAWHRLALSISGSQVELLVDCHPLYRRLLGPGPPDTNFTLPQLQLWVGQRNAKHFLFKGALQDVKLIPGAHGYLSQCPQLDSSCPTCGQFSILQNTVEQLMHNLNELTRRLAAAEGRISKVEECECQKSCRTNGTVHEDGATWEKGCEQCSCVHGDIECRPTPCAPVSCKHPVVPTGQCCPVCLKQCYLHGIIYDHAEKVSPKQCVECDCYDGSFTCQRFDTETRCPPLPCPPNEQISVAEECCKFCPGVDYCAKGHECHVNASCLNLQTTYACHCNIGFHGDGHKCHDVDECKQQGGSEGHHCNANTRCLNVIGSYTCDCLPGYQRIDKFNCAELDECATGRHTCDEHATCVNTAGSYYCVCNEGYDGDGHTCKPKCEQSCQNGGECVAPGRCSCRRGYIGNSCELDLDECASDLHRCHSSSTCFNMPGWYYCRCKPGYRSALHETNQGTQCIDIDECNDETIEIRHTCHPSARCVNVEGGYECSCAQRDEQSTTLTSSSSSLTNNDCRLSCWYEDREVANGEDFAPVGNPCRRCECKNGVITCREPLCDCSATASRRDKCCPQCDPAASCRHQELHHLVFRSGERWIYQCQTCECLYGEIDCWQMECPPVTCVNPVTEDGDCCPRCEDDPCARELPDATERNFSSAVRANDQRPRPCSYAGFVHESGNSWQDSHDKCTTCECKDGQLCCSYDYRCAGDLENNRKSSIDVVTGDAVDLSRGPNAVGENFVSPKAALSTIKPDREDFVSTSSISISINGGNGAARLRTRRPSNSRTTTNGLFTNQPVATSISSSNSDNVITNKPSTIIRLPVENRKSKIFTTDNVNPTTSIRKTIGKITRTDDNSRIALSLPNPTSSSSSSSTSKTPSTSKIDLAKKFSTFNNIPNSRYTTNNLNERKKNFITVNNRRRDERGPRLVNGNPSGHDAT